MPTPVINYAGQPYSAGATWQTNNAFNLGAQEVTDFTNASGVTLYPGDVVVIGSTPAVPATDPACFNVTTTTSVNSTLAIGVVGGMTNQVYAGGPIPFQTSSWRYDTVVVAASATQPDTAAVAGDVGKEVIGTNIPSGAYIVSVVAGTSFTMNVAATGTGSTVLAIGPREGAVGPGWMGVPAGEVCPVVLQGPAYVNIGANTVAAGALLNSSGTARQASSVTSAATLIGTYIGVALEAQTAGIASAGGPAGALLIRAWIQKF